MEERVSGLTTPRSHSFNLNDADDDSSLNLTNTYRRTRERHQDFRSRVQNPLTSPCRVEEGEPPISTSSAVNTTRGLTSHIGQIPASSHREESNGEITGGAHYFSFNEQGRISNKMRDLSKSQSKKRGGGGGVDTSGGGPSDHSKISSISSHSNNSKNQNGSKSHNHLPLIPGHILSFQKQQQSNHHTENPENYLIDGQNPFRRSDDSLDVPILEEEEKESIETLLAEETRREVGMATQVAQQQIQNTNGAGFGGLRQQHEDTNMDQYFLEKTGHIRKSNRADFQTAGFTRGGGLLQSSENDTDLRIEDSDLEDGLENGGQEDFYKNDDRLLGRYNKKFGQFTSTPRTMRRGVQDEAINGRFRVDQHYQIQKNVGYTRKESIPKIGMPSSLLDQNSLEADLHALNSDHILNPGVNVPLREINLNRVQEKEEEEEGQLGYLMENELKKKSIQSQESEGQMSKRSLRSNLEMIPHYQNLLRKQNVGGDLNDINLQRKPTGSYSIQSKRKGSKEIIAKNLMNFKPLNQERQQRQKYSQEQQEEIIGDQNQNLMNFKLKNMKNEENKNMNLQRILSKRTSKSNLRNQINPSEGLSKVKARINTNLFREKKSPKFSKNRIRKSNQQTKNSLHQNSHQNVDRGSSSKVINIDIDKLCGRGLHSSKSRISKNAKLTPRQENNNFKSAVLRKKVSIPEMNILNAKKKGFWRNPELTSSNQDFRKILKNKNLKKSDLQVFSSQVDWRTALKNKNIDNQKNTLLNNDRRVDIQFQENQKILEKEKENEDQILQYIKGSTQKNLNPIPVDKYSRRDIEYRNINEDIEALIDKSESSIDHLSRSSESYKSHRIGRQYQQYKHGKKQDQQDTQEYQKLKNKFQHISSPPSRSNHEKDSLLIPSQESEIESSLDPTSHHHQQKNLNQQYYNNNNHHHHGQQQHYQHQQQQQQKLHYSSSSQYRENFQKSQPKFQPEKLGETGRIIPYRKHSQPLNIQNTGLNPELKNKNSSNSNLPRKRDPSNYSSLVNPRNRPSPQKIKQKNPNPHQSQPHFTRNKSNQNQRPTPGLKSKINFGRTESMINRTYSGNIPLNKSGSNPSFVKRENRNISSNSNSSFKNLMRKTQASNSTKNLRVENLGGKTSHGFGSRGDINKQKMSMKFTRSKNFGSEIENKIPQTTKHQNRKTGGSYLQNYKQNFEEKGYKTSRGLAPNSPSIQSSRNQTHKVDRKRMMKMNQNLREVNSNNRKKKQFEHILDSVQFQDDDICYKESKETRDPEDSMLKFKKNQYKDRSKYGQRGGGAGRPKTKTGQGFEDDMYNRLHSIHSQAVIPERGDHEQPRTRRNMAPFQKENLRTVAACNIKIDINKFTKKVISNLGDKMSHQQE